MISGKIDRSLATPGTLPAAGADEALLQVGVVRAAAKTSHSGRLIVNADDWGEQRDTTDRTLECVQAGAVSSVSAIMFMADSARAAAIARERGLDVGLHLNLVTPFSAPGCPPRLQSHLEKASRFLMRGHFAQVVYHPGLTRSFEYLVAVQLEEFRRLYGAEPDRIDGHHHMHLCANVVLGRLLPAGTIVRRNFFFRPGEKAWSHRLYRRTVDRLLARRHRITDFFFSLPPLHPAERLHWIFSVARHSVVELETHPVNVQEYQFLTGGEIFRWAENIPLAPNFKLCSEEENDVTGRANGHA